MARRAHERLDQCAQDAGLVHRAAVIILVRRLVREGWTRSRWDHRPGRTP
jgi:hypothetical protein